MFGFLKGIFRTKISELEAKLHPTVECKFGGVGEIELSWFSNGDIQLELSLKRSGVPDGAKLEFYAGGEALGATSSQRGYANAYHKIVGRSLNVSHGTPAELRVNGVTAYRGEFVPD